MNSAQLLNMLLSIIGVLITGMAGIFLNEFSALRKSVEELNKSIAGVIEKINHHEARIERLEGRIDG